MEKPAKKQLAKWEKTRASVVPQKPEEESVLQRKEWPAVPQAGETDPGPRGRSGKRCDHFNQQHGEHW